MELVLVLLVVVALVATFVGVATSRRRGPHPDLEPPPTTGAPTQEGEAAAPGVEAPMGTAEAPPAEAPAGPSAPPVEVPAESLEAPPAPTVEPPAGPSGPVAPPEPAAPAVEAPAEPTAPPEPPRPRFRDRLGKARSLLATYLGSALSRPAIDDETWDELEEALIRADVGVGLTSSVLDDLRTRVKAEGISTPDALLVALKEDLKEKLAHGDRTLRHEPGAPNVWLFVGVNGVGKTTTIGKLGLREAAAGRTVVMAAGDTFRAAAGQQLELWAERVGADVVRGAEGGDPGSVVFDAVERAAARGADLVLADTAGRLHTKVNLMEELKKVRRIAERPPGRLTEVLLVIDATTGQNGLVQARQFTEAVAVTGVVLTKLDGTAKGGVALAIAADMGLPIKLVGLGEKAEDLVTFDPDEFVEALFS